MFNQLENLRADKNHTNACIEELKNTDTFIFSIEDSTTYSPNDEKGKELLKAFKLHLVEQMTNEVKAISKQIKLLRAQEKKREKQILVVA